MSTPGLEVKQVIVMRDDLNMRKGKMIAQGAHASLAFLSDKIGLRRNGKITKDLTFDAEEKEWMSGPFKKVCVRVNSEEELLEIYKKALEAGLRSHIILDSGKTEFNGKPTYTCVAIGPNYEHKINVITGELKLL
jgi:peptidyl-tRNA hydrolase, PTH2 family